MKIWILLFILLVGIGLGLGAPSVAPKYLSPYFPKGFTEARTGVKGVVVKKQLEEDRLLLTISAPDGALLATFQKNLTEISLLVDQGDTLTLDLQVYAPFVKDPPILRVKKPDEGGSQSPVAESDEAQSESPSPVPSDPALSIMPPAGSEETSDAQDPPRSSPEPESESKPFL